jgi:hypothetical protein
MRPERRASQPYRPQGRGSRGQSAIEYLIITAFVLGVLVPALLLVTKTVADYRQATALNALNRIGQDLLANAESVFFFGPPSQVILAVEMPDGVRNMSLHRNDPAGGCTRCTELRFSVGRDQELILSTDVDVRGLPPMYDGAGTTAFNQTYYSPGRKRILIKALPSYVLVSLTT